MTRLTLQLTNRVISKKNSKRRIMRGGRIFTVPSVAYERFAAQAVIEISQQIINDVAVRKLLPFTGDLTISTTFDIKGAYKVDADNLHTSILDILQDARIIADDCQVVSGSYEKRVGQKNWHTHIIITSQ